MMRDHGRCHDSDAAKVQLSSGQRSLAQAKEFPNSNDPNGPRCVQRSGYYGKGDYPRPHPERGQSARLRHRTTKKNDTAKYTIKVCLLILLQSRENRSSLPSCKKVKQIIIRSPSRVAILQSFFIR